MTTLNVEVALGAEIKRILSPIHSTRQDGEPVAGVTLFLHNLPRKAMSDPRPFVPYAIVRVFETSTENDTDDVHVKAEIDLAFHDDGADQEGHMTLITALDMIFDRFASNRDLASQYNVEQNITTHVQDGDFWPYFLGDVELTVTMSKIKRKDMLINGERYKESSGPRLWEL